MYQWKTIAITLCSFVTTTHLAWSQSQRTEPYHGTVEIYSAEQNAGTSAPSFKMSGEGVRILYEAIVDLSKKQIQTIRSSDSIQITKFGKNITCSRTEYLQSKKVEYKCFADLLSSGETGFFAP